jgi:hypothetical protein
VAQGIHGRCRVRFGAHQVLIVDAADYSQTKDCDGRIPARSNCTMTVTFTPQTKGQLNSVLAFNSTASGMQVVTSITVKARGE